MPTGQLFVWLLIVGVTMLFAALSSAAIVRIGIDGRMLRLPSIVWLNTVVLLISSAALGAVQWHVRAHRTVDTLALRLLWIGVGLGLLFLVGQAVAWMELVRAGIGLPSFPAASFFYVLSAAHGLHVVGGIVALLLLFAVRKRTLLFRHRLGPVATYWHFMALVWIGLLAVLQAR
ncbi:MAG: cytochrome c oxidase subunit 3 [Candidatus Kapabacteria bacterium]|nr:cytochrome c oxidase subunit 3 [Candidatus Kapabacteria bacterium]MDW8011971.1 cytochrome c oxidase subunit 3 [Bacteroidota bacterium]